MYLMTVMEIGSTHECTAEGAALPPPPPAARRVTISFVPEGRTEAEQIELWQPLGKGAYGVVYSGSWRGGQVAVKVGGLGSWARGRTGWCTRAAGGAVRSRSRYEDRNGGGSQ